MITSKIFFRKICCSLFRGTASSLLLFALACSPTFVPKNSISKGPFPYRLKMDHLASMSCSNMALSTASSDQFFHFALAAKGDSSGLSASGSYIGKTSTFLSWLFHLDYLKDLGFYEVQPHLAVRSPAAGWSYSSSMSTSFFTPLEHKSVFYDAILAPALEAHQSGQKETRYPWVRGEGGGGITVDRGARVFDKSINVEDMEGLFNVLNSSDRAASNEENISFVLSATFTPKDLLGSGVGSEGKFYGELYFPHFEKASNFSPNPLNSARRRMTSVVSKDISELGFSETWAGCASLMIKARNACVNNAGSSHYVKARYFLPEEDWSVGTDCIAPKTDAADQCYSWVDDAGGSVNFNGGECSLGAGEGEATCPHYFSVCWKGSL